MELENVSLTEAIQAAHESTLLKQYLFKKLKGYCGISHNELDDICAMFGIREEGDGT